MLFCRWCHLLVKSSFKKKSPYWKRAVFNLKVYKRNELPKYIYHLTTRCAAVTSQQNNQRGPRIRVTLIFRIALWSEGCIRHEAALVPVRLKKQQWGGSFHPGKKKSCARWFKVTFSSPSWRSLNPLKGSLNHPKKVTLNHLVALSFLAFFKGFFIIQRLHDAKLKFWDYFKMKNRIDG